MLRSSPMGFWGGLGVCFLFVVGVVLLVRSFSQGDLCTSGVVLFMKNINDEFLAARAKKFCDLQAELNHVWVDELNQLDALRSGWVIEQTGGNVFVMSYYFPDHSEYEDGHYLMVSPLHSMVADRSELLEQIWLVGHYGGRTENTSECDEFSGFAEALKQVKGILSDPDLVYFDPWFSAEGE